MKIETHGTINFNHVQQYKNSVTLGKATVSSHAAETLSPHSLKNTSSPLVQVQSLQENNEIISSLQILRSSLDSLSSNTIRLQELASRYEDAFKNKDILEDEFMRISEQMMDTIDNSVYNGHHLFGNYVSTVLDKGIPSLETMSNIESLDISDKEGLSSFSKELRGISQDVETAIGFLNLSATNTLAAMSSQASQVSQEKLLKAHDETMPVEGLKESHDMTQLRYKVRELLA